LNNIFNADQIPCYYDSVRASTLHMKGVGTVGTSSIARLAGDKQVELCTTGHEKDRFTVHLLANADGSALTCHIIFKGIRPVKVRCPPNITG
jgi:hypothetical protein